MIWKLIGVGCLTYYRRFFFFCTAHCFPISLRSHNWLSPCIQNNLMVEITTRFQQPLATHTSFSGTTMHLWVPSEGNVYRHWSSWQRTKLSISRGSFTWRECCRCGDGWSLCLSTVPTVCPQGKYWIVKLLILRIGSRKFIEK